MEARNQEYLIGLGITQSQRPEAYNAVERCFNILKAITPEDPNDMFISDIIEPGSNLRMFQSLFLFAGRYIAEARNLQLGKEHQRFYVDALDQNIISIEFSMEEYEWGEVKDTSAVVMSVSLRAGCSCYLRAVGKNCEKLKQIYESRFKGNFVIR